jgi:hypothetical protein
VVARGGVEPPTFRFSADGPSRDPGGRDLRWMRGDGGAGMRFDTYLPRDSQGWPDAVGHAAVGGVPVLDQRVGSDGSLSAVVARDCSLGQFRGQRRRELWQGGLGSYSRRSGRERVMLPAPVSRSATGWSSSSWAATS